MALGNGSDITSVTFDGMMETIVSQSANSVVVVTQAATSAKQVDIVVISASVGTTTLKMGFEFDPGMFIF